MTLLQRDIFKPGDQYHATHGLGRSVQRTRGRSGFIRSSAGPTGRSSSLSESKCLMVEAVISGSTTYRPGRSRHPSQGQSQRSLCRFPDRHERDLMPAGPPMDVDDLYALRNLANRLLSRSSEPARRATRRHCFSPSSAIWRRDR